jgi:Tfp pilus assembly protein PilX
MRRSHSQQGSVLVLTLLVTMIILGIGLTVMWVASSSMKMSGNLTRRQEAFNAAEAGIERARSILMSPAFKNDWNPLLAGCGSALDSDLVGRILCDGATALANVHFIAGATAGKTNSELQKVNYTVWIRNDWASECVNVSGGASKVDCNGDGTEETDVKKLKSLPNVDSNRRVIVRSQGVGRDGISIVTLEVIVAGTVLPSGGSSYIQAGINAQGSSSGQVSIGP